MRELVDNINLLAQYLTIFLDERDRDFFYKEIDSKLFGQNATGKDEITPDNQFKIAIDKLPKKK